MRHTYQLRERTPCDCRLTPADVEFLLARHRRHVRLLPTCTDGVCRVIPTGHVGTIVTPTCRLHIRPKIPLDNLFYLLDPAAPLPAATARGEARPDADLLDFLAGRLARLMTERTQAGLHRAYAERAEYGPFLHGRLDPASQLREAAGRKDRLHCRFDDWTVDVPCNQAPKAAAELLLRSPLVCQPVRHGLIQALSGFADVQSVPLNEQTLAAATPDRLTEDYRPLWELCRLLADSLTGTEGTGDAACPAFLVDMERVFEQYVARELSARLGEGLSLSVQPWVRVAPPAPGRPGLGLRPDLVLLRDGRPAAVLDTKWKRLPLTRLLTSDVYQVLAYCTTVGVRQAVLVYPGRRGQTWAYTLERSPVRLWIQALRVVGTREQCAASMNRLGRRLRLSVGGR